MHGNPYLKVLRGQLEGYIAKKQGARHLAEAKHAAELRKISSEITSLKRRLTALQKRKVELESGKS